MLRAETARNAANVAKAHRRKMARAATQGDGRKVRINNRHEPNVVKDRRRKVVLEMQGGVRKAHPNKVARATQVADRKAHRSSAMPDAVRVMRDADLAKKAVAPKAQLSRPARNAVKAHRHQADEAKNAAHPAATKAAVRATMVAAPPAPPANEAAA